VQDSWAVSNRVRVNFGIRWDGLYFKDTHDKLAQKITDQTQPRLGLIWQPGKIGNQKIFGSYGRFYQHLPLRWSGAYRTGYEYVIDYEHDPRFNTTGGDTLAISGIRPPADQIKGLEGQFFDEITVGYERQLDDYHIVKAMGIYRNLGQAIDDGLDPQKGWIRGNPGKGELSFLPEFKKKYLALELTLARQNPHLSYALSYVLSRNSGNYTGLFDIENGLGPIPNQSRLLDMPEQIPNSTGLLATDRTHSIKFNSSYRFNFGLQLGTLFILQRGNPITEFGGTSFGEPVYSYLTPRGSLGRMPWLWDLNLRLTYNLQIENSFPLATRIILDFQHIGNPREIVDIDQIHYFSIEDGSQSSPNPNYLQPKAFQPPMSVRLGFEVSY
jgi:hypothetical protein